MSGVWDFRPSALSSNYAEIGIGRLFALYNQDNHQQQQNQQGKGTFITLPKKSSSLRTCQWNINDLRYASEKWVSSETEAAREIARELMSTDSDVLILNEFGDFCCNDDDDDYYCDQPMRVLKSALEASGYSVHVAASTFPTAIATRLVPVVVGTSGGGVSRCNLDQSRSAVGVRVEMAIAAAEDDINEQTTTTRRRLRIYGTHLDDSDDQDGILRLKGMETLLEHIQKEMDSNSGDETTKNDDIVLIVGDLNQQRERDYTPQEWEAICANKKRRNSPTDDGVARLLEQQGFVCSYDCIPWRQEQQRQKPPAQINWKAEDPPPSTHWTGTVIDYSYGRGKNLRVAGIYVSPCGLSDHRLIVTDWDLSSREVESYG